METTTRICALRELIPATPIHPGEMIKDELQAQGVSQRKFVGITGMPYTAFNEIINGHRPITNDTALKIEAATGIQTARRDSGLSAVLDQTRKTVAAL